MARWDKILSRGNIEDRRGAPMALGGGLGITGIAVLLLFNYLSGGDMGDVLTQLNEIQVPQSSMSAQVFQGADQYEVFASTVLGSANDMWRSVFAQDGRTYEEPRLVLFRNVTPSSCGTATSQVGPHYCPLDKTIYIDETFFDELSARFGAKGGDVAEAYVIAHEAAHHAQNEFGIMNEARGGDTNDMSIRLELQADCFAGLWAHSIRDLGIFEPGEIEEAIDAAAAVGDDRVQQKVSGQIDPETWTHGSSAERVGWFNRGYESGTPSSCDTFK